jgi:putative acetyltransferase
MTPNITIAQEHPDSPDAMLLIGELQAGLTQMDYPEESRHGYNVDKLIREGVAFFITRLENIPAGCGGIQLFGTEYGEVKRMFVRTKFRGLGLAKFMLDHLAEYARGKQVPILRLETGIYQKEAINLYERHGFERCSPFGEYVDDPLSVYFEKHITNNGVKI